MAINKDPDAPIFQGEIQNTVYSVICYVQTSNSDNPRIVCANLGFDLCARNPIGLPVQS